MPAHDVSGGKGMRNDALMITRTDHGIRKVLYGKGNEPHERSLATRGSECGGKVNDAEGEGTRMHIRAKREIKSLEEKVGFKVHARNNA